MAFYKVRVWASLGVGGYKQESILFNVQIIKDPCSYYPYVTSFVEDLTLWVNETTQTVAIPPFTMVDTAWSCNFSYSITAHTNLPLDPIFIVNETAAEGQATNITLVTSDRAKVDLSPQVVRVKGWPKRQNWTAQNFTFRIFVAYNDPTECPPGKFYDTALERCVGCTSPCSTCKDSPTACTWCVPGYTFYESTSTCL